MAPHPRVPDQLRGIAFTTAEAAHAGVSASMLRGRVYEQMHRGVWRVASTDVTPELSIRAALLALPPGAALSHVSALQWMGVPVGPPRPLHFSVHGTTQTRLDLVVHRREGRLTVRDVRGLPTLGPDRSFVDSATLLGRRDLVRAGDALVRAGLTTVEGLIEHAMTSHLDGVVRARLAAVMVRERVDSFRETDLRLLMQAGHLPTPEVNVDVRADDGTWLARGDLVLPRWRVVVEYDGWHHERSAEQRQSDHLRRERIERAGWSLIVVTAADFRQPITVVRRIFSALVTHGYAGPPPVLSADWSRYTRDL